MQTSGGWGKTYLGGQARRGPNREWAGECECMGLELERSYRVVSPEGGGVPAIEGVPGGKVSRALTSQIILIILFACFTGC